MGAGIPHSRKKVHAQLSAEEREDMLWRQVRVKAEANRKETQKLKHANIGKQETELAKRELAQNTKRRFYKQPLSLLAPNTDPAKTAMARVGPRWPKVGPHQVRHLSCKIVHLQYEIAAAVRKVNERSDIFPSRSDHFGFQGEAV